MSIILFLGEVGQTLLKRSLESDEEVPPEDDTDVVTDEIFLLWALFILLFLLGSALWSLYFLQQRRIKAIHETVLSIFYGMVVGLIIRVSPGHYIQDAVKFNSGYFFNILLPPIILNSGYELHQANFFSNLGLILTFAIPGTFISAVVLGIILYVYTALGLDGINLEFVDALSVGATLSATDPVTILSIFNAYKVDPKLYTIIFGESLLNDAISIVMFETCQKFKGHPVGFSSLFEGMGLFLMSFTISTIIGMMVGIGVALILKHSHIRRYPQIETCLVLLFAYETYFFSTGAHMSGIVSLLFCGITLKHYAYYNMLRRTQIATKYIFQLLAQLLENFIFIYLGLSLFTEVRLVFKPLLIIIAFMLICVARWAAVFPLSKFLNFLYRARFEKFQRPGMISTLAVPDEILHLYQMMIFWAGLRGAVGVALALGIHGDDKWTLLGTVLVVVVLTVILFGGTTALMLEILGIRTGCVDDSNESDDDFDIEAPRIIEGATNLYGNRRPGTGVRVPQPAPYKDDAVSSRTQSAVSLQGIYPTRSRGASRTSSQNDLLLQAEDDEFTVDVNEMEAHHDEGTSGPGGLLSNILSVDEHAKWFTRFDEQVLKPVLLDNQSPGPSQSPRPSTDRQN